LCVVFCVVCILSSVLCTVFGSHLSVLSVLLSYVFAAPIGTLALVNMASPGSRNSSNATNVPLPISVRTKVCRYKDGVFTDGVVIEIKTSKARKQKVTLKCYVIQFDGLEQLVCDEDTVRMLMACFASRQNKGRTNHSRSTTSLKGPGS
jgi:hypothetical protein